MILPRIYAFHSIGTKDKTLWTITYYSTVSIHTSSAITYTGYFLAFINVYVKRNSYYEKLYLWV